MTIVLLASVSLFALVVTSRPILSPNIDIAPASSRLQTSVQGPFRIHPGKDDLASDAARFHFQGSMQHTEYPSELGKETVAAIASFQILSKGSPSFSAFSDETTDVQDKINANGGHNENRAKDEPAASQLAVDLPTHDSSYALPVVLVFTCIAALLALACIGLSLYITKSLRYQMLASRAAWDLLPRFCRLPRSQENTTAIEKLHLSGGSSLLFQSARLLGAEEGSALRHELRPGDKPFRFNAVSDLESELDDVDEKYLDALDMTPLPLTHDLPLEDNVSRPSHFDDPPLLHPESRPLDPPMSDRSTTLMCESCPSPPPVSRPAWSVRAIDSPTLGLSSRQGGVDATPQSLINSRRRAYRSPVPEFDIALAMQLRPGLGISADSAWMVRFLMAIFGWFAVALTGNAR